MLKLYTSQEKLPIDLSLGESPLSPSPRILMAISEAAKNANRYPDPECIELKKSLANKFSLPEPFFIVGNGSEELIALITQNLIKPRDEVVIPKVTFPLFEKAVRLAFGIPVFSKMRSDFSINLKAIKGQTSFKTKLIFICNPNNPTGTMLPKKAIIKFVRQVSPVIVVVDEAHIEFGGKSVIKSVKELKNLIVLRTFSKASGLAGLRIGFAVANPKIIKVLRKNQQLFAVNSLAQAAAIAVLKDEKQLNKNINSIQAEKRFLARQLKKRGFEIIGSRTISLFVRVPKKLMEQDFPHLLRNQGVSVVNGSSFRKLTSDFIRITPQKRDINKKFLTTIDKIMVKQ